MIQRNAIGSWMQLNPKPEVLVMGNEPGSKEICQEFNLIHIPDVKLSDLGTPMLDDMFAKTESIATNNLCLLVAADIILFQDTIEMAKILRDHLPKFMATLRRRDKNVDSLIDFNDTNWSQNVLSNSVLGHPGAGDFFLYPKGFFVDGIPPFTIGRASADNWLIYEAVRLGCCVDMAESMNIIHQNHDYSHLGGHHNLTNGEEFKSNRNLGAGKMLEISGSNWLVGSDKIPRKK
jgi:hypothetical protein